MAIIKGVDGKNYLVNGELVVADLQAKLDALVVMKASMIQKTNDSFDPQITELQNTINEANAL
jgi:hypothetical protein